MTHLLKSDAIQLQISQFLLYPKMFEKRIKKFQQNSISDLRFLKEISTHPRPNSQKGQAKDQLKTSLIYPKIGLQLS